MERAVKSGRARPACVEEVMKALSLSDFGPMPRKAKAMRAVMPAIRIHNRTKGSLLSDGVVIKVRAGATNEQGIYEGEPKEIEVMVGKYVNYYIPDSAFRITAEPEMKMKAVNWVQQEGMVKKDQDLYIIASKEHLDISFDKQAS